ncbi:hypothetical protein XENOCAPTIV_013163, partial [Xenoophorus captivus]
VVFGSIVLLMLWLPIRIIKLLFPAFLPYNVMLYRVPLDQTPLFYPWQKGIPEGAWNPVSITSSFLQVYANGIRNIDLHFIVRRLAAPVICLLLLSLCVPYSISKGLTPLLGIALNVYLSCRCVFGFNILRYFYTPVNK